MIIISKRCPVCARRLDKQGFCPNIKRCAKARADKEIKELQKELNKE